MTEFSQLCNLMFKYYISLIYKYLIVNKTYNLVCYEFKINIL